jgi:catechol 2,3-dioxygenase-like lactoylglutathione lyase family enzyme
MRASRIADRGRREWISGAFFVPTGVMHHVDVHVSDISKTKQLFDALAPVIHYVPRSEYDEFISYRPADRPRPAVGFLLDPEHVAGSMRLAFAVATQAAVDAAAEAVRANGARQLEGPGFHPEYGDDYYAVFFEDADGNKYEVCHDAEAS